MKSSFCQVIIGFFVLALMCSVFTPMVDAFQGVNGRIVFISKRDNPTYWEIYTMNPDGSGVQRLTTNHIDEERPGFSPDGTRIVYSSRSSANASEDIFVMNADGSNQTRLTTGNALENGPQWSSDGSKILYKKEVNGQDDIWIMNADGSNQRALVNSSTHNESSPVWASDNSGIAFAYKLIGSDVPVEIYSSNVSGGQLFRVTNNMYLDTAPAWSPDSQKLVFRSTRPVNGVDQKNDLYVINRDGTQERHVVSHPAEDRGPAWSPDGTKIIFFSNRPDAQGNTDYDIWTVNSATGGNPVNLTPNSPADDWSPDWGTMSDNVSPPPPTVTSTPLPSTTPNPTITPSLTPTTTLVPTNSPVPGNPADVDNNGTVNLADLQAIIANFNQTQFSIRDPQPDGRITIYDFSLVVKALYTQNPTATPTTGPTPTIAPPPTLGPSPTPAPTPTSTPPSPTPTTGPRQDDELVLFDEDVQFVQSDRGFHVLKPNGSSIPGIPNNWNIPKNYYRGTLYFRYRMVTPPANQRTGKFQVCVWQMPGFNPETCSDKVLQSGTLDTKYYQESVSTWWKLDDDPNTNPDLGPDFSDFRRYLVRAVLIGRQLIPNSDPPLLRDCIVTNIASVDKKCPEQFEDFARMKYRLTVVMVPENRSFSGWGNF